MRNETFQHLVLVALFMILGLLLAILFMIAQQPTPAVQIGMGGSSHAVGTTQHSANSPF